MNNLKNRVQLIGNLGSTPEIKTFENGKKMARMSVATNDTYKDAQGKKVTETQWHTVVAWGPTATFAEKYLSKGSELALEGKLTHRTYEDKDGTKKYMTEVVASELLMLNGKGKE